MAKIDVRLIGSAVLETLSELAKEETKEERCGLLFGFRRHSGGRTLYLLYRAIPVANTADNPMETFVISGRDARKEIAAARKRGRLNPVGVYHTHPPQFTAEPSKKDRNGLPPKQIGAVVGVGAGIVTFYDGIRYEHRIDLIDD